MERTLTFTMEDALISPMGIAILTGAGLIDATAEKTIPQHVTETVKAEGTSLTLKKYSDWDEDEIEVEDEIADLDIWVCELDGEGNVTGEFKKGKNANGTITIEDGTITSGKFYMVDYYVVRSANLMQIDIEPDKFGGNYYLEASTLFRDQSTGTDYPAEFILPNCRIQSNFTFTMAPTGDPSTFTFTVDAFPGVTKYDASKKVLCAIQVYSGE